MTPSRWHRRWWASFALLFSLSAVWALSNPLFSGPDEASHVIKAAAVVRGQLRGPEVQVAPGEWWTYVRVPGSFRGAAQVPACFVFKPSVPAGCAPDLPTDRATTSVPTEAGRYPPLYYALVGAPTLLFPSAFGVYLMRFLSAAACAALVASALESAFIGARSKTAVLGVAVAVTPMVIFVSAIVNPSSLEIAAAICLWASALAATCGEGAPSNRVVARVAVSASALVLTRTIAPLWVALIAATVAAAAGREPLRRLYHHRAVRQGAVVVAGSAALAAAWLTLAGGPHLTKSMSGRGIGGGTGDLVSMAIGRVPFNLEQTVGWFGWLDTRAPAWTYAVWAVMLAVLVVAAAATGRRRVAVAALVTAGLAVVVPVALEAWWARRVGAFWQGRYSLPLAVGVPLLAGFAFRPGRTALTRRLAALVVVGFASAHVGAYVQVMRRYVVGLPGPVDYLDGGGWSPPLPPVLLLVAVVAATALLGWWLYRLAADPGVPSEPPLDGESEAGAEPGR